MSANLPLPFKKPFGAAGRGLPAAALASGENSRRLVPDDDADSGYFRALESRGLFLNGPQIEAVRHGAGPLLTLAGAGSGKTSVLAARTGYLIAERGADPRSILLVTFSVKAAQEMKDRISALPGIAPAAAKAVTARTFHSFFLQLLRSQGYRQEILGGGPLAVIVLKGMLRELGIADRLEPETALAALSEAKLSLRPLGELPEASQAERDLKRLLLRFEEWKEREGRMDFDDILLWSHRLLTERPALLRTLQERFRLIMIDEFQDTSRLQYELIRLLAGKRANLMAVGDDDQTIYGFSGARSEYILGFRDAFPGARVVTLDTNYRSSASIVGLGNDIIRHNKARYAKTLKAVRTSRQVPLYIRPFTTDQEARPYPRAGRRGRARLGRLRHPVSHRQQQPGDVRAARAVGHPVPSAGQRRAVLRPVGGAAARGLLAPVGQAARLRGDGGCAALDVRGPRQGHCPYPRQKRPAHPSAHAGRAQGLPARLDPGPDHVHQGAEGAEAGGRHPPHAQGLLRRLARRRGRRRGRRRHRLQGNAARGARRAGGIRRPLRRRAVVPRVREADRRAPRRDARAAAGGGPRCRQAHDHPQKQGAGVPGRRPHRRLRGHPAPQPRARGGQAVRLRQRSGCGGRSRLAAGGRAGGGAPPRLRRRHPRARRAARQLAEPVARAQDGRVALPARRVPHGRSCGCGGWQSRGRGCRAGRWRFGRGRGQSGRSERSDERYRCGPAAGQSGRSPR